MGFSVCPEHPKGPAGCWQVVTGLVAPMGPPGAEWMLGETAVGRCASEELASGGKALGDSPQCYSAWLSSCSLAASQKAAQCWPESEGADPSSGQMVKWRKAALQHAPAVPTGCWFSSGGQPSSSTAALSLPLLQEAGGENTTHGARGLRYKKFN